MASKKKDVYEIVTEKILDKLEKGTVPWHKPWSVSGTVTRSYAGHAYRGVNVFLAVTSGHNGPWITYRKVKEMGGHVKKGEKGQLIVFWKLHKKEVEKDGKKEEKKFMILRYYRVWSLEQTTGVPKPKWMEKTKEKEKEVSPIKRAEKIWKEYENAPGLKHGGGRACYFPSKDLVHMPKRNTFDDSEEYYSTLFHEGIHSTGHHTRLNRFLKDQTLDPFGGEDYSKEELVAEMGAAFLMAETGIERERTLSNSAAYIKTWMSNLRDDPKLVVRAAACAQKAYDHVLNRKFEEEKS